MHKQWIKPLAAALLGASLSLPAAAAGVSDSVIRLGGVMDLEGDSQGLGQGMKTGLEAAFNNRTAQGRRIEFIARNDYYNPATTKQQTEALLNEGVFAMVGNVGTPTAAASLPVLADAGVPAVGFFTGAGLLRPGPGTVINYRASYVQETAAVIETALAGGVKPGEICAFVQNDAYGMAGVAGIKNALGKTAGSEPLIELIGQIAALPGDNPPRNHHGPIGVYTRNTLTVKDGYRSLKTWERTSGNRCRLVVTVGTYAAIGRFIAYARLQGESWLYSAVSFTGAENLQNTLAVYGVHNGVIISEVVPQLDSPLPIVAEARRDLGEKLNYVSLEGYIVGRMLLTMIDSIDGELTAENLAAAVEGKVFDLGGLVLDFSDDNQGSDLVSMIYLADKSFRVVSADELMSLLNS